LSDNNYVQFGASTKSQIGWNTAQATQEALMILTPSSNPSVIIANLDHKAKNYDQSGWAFPVLLLFSATDPDSDNTEYLAVYHDSANANIESGKGDIALTPASGLVTFANCTLGGATVTHDDYFEMSINGVTKKVMLGS